MHPHNGSSTNDAEKLAIYSMFPFILVSCLLHGFVYDLCLQKQVWWDKHSRGCQSLAGRQGENIFSGVQWDGFGEIGDNFHLGLCIISYFSFAVKRPHD